MEEVVILLLQKIDAKQLRERIHVAIGEAHS